MTETKVPEKLFVQMFVPRDVGLDKTFRASEYDPREVHDNNTPVYEYISLATRNETWEAAARRLRSLYEPVFAIKSTGDPKHPVRAEIDWDAKAIFDGALEAAAMTITLESDMERNAMIDTISGLERERDELREALQSHQ